MKKLIFIFTVLLTPLIAVSDDAFYQLSAKTIRGKKLNFSTFKGKNVLFVNIASRCGYTPQLESLQQLHEKYQNKNLVIVGVPSNEFGGQTPEEDGEMAKFCKLNYGVNFQLLSKTKVKGDSKHPVFKHLIENSKSKSEISWNFEKFLVNAKGDVVARFRSGDSPLGNKIEQEIKKIVQ